MTQQAGIRYASTADGVDIAYATLGSGPPVVLAGAVAAAGIDVSLASDRFMSRYRRLAEGHTLVVFDWRGLGASGPAAGGFSLSGFLRDLAAVADAIGASTFDLIGQASPAQVAIEFAATNPERVRRLALTYTGSGASPRLSKRFRDIHAIAADDWSRFAELFSLVSYGWTDIELARVSRARLESRFSSQLWDDLMTALESLDCVHRAPELVMPLSIHLNEGFAEPATVAEARRLVAAAPQAELRMHSGGQGAEVVALMFDSIASSLSEQPALVPEEHHLQTVMFTDLVGSTEMHTRLGDDAARAIVEAHDLAVRRAIGEFNGREVKHTGDGMMATFSSALDAVRCALAVRQEIETYNASHDAEEIHVRFGLNAGEPIVDENRDLFGLSVTLAARIADWGAPGRVLVSDVVRQLLLGKGINFSHAGDAELKGFPEPIAVHEALEASD